MRHQIYETEQGFGENVQFATAPNSERDIDEEGAQTNRPQGKLELKDIMYYSARVGLATLFIANTMSYAGGMQFFPMQQGVGGVVPNEQLAAVEGKYTHFKCVYS